MDCDNIQNGKSNTRDIKIDDVGLRGLLPVGKCDVGKGALRGPLPVGTCEGKGVHTIRYHVALGLKQQPCNHQRQKQRSSHLNWNPKNKHMTKLKSHGFGLWRCGNRFGILIEVLYSFMWIFDVTVCMCGGDASLLFNAVHEKPMTCINLSWPLICL